MSAAQTQVEGGPGAGAPGGGEASGSGPTGLGLVVPVVVVLAAIGVISLAAARHRPVVAMVASAFLAVAGSWLHVRLRRLGPSGLWWRVGLEVALLVAGIVVVVLTGGSWALVGVATSLMAASMLVSEWRRSTTYRAPNAWLLLALAVVGLLVGAVLPAGGPAFTVVVVGLVLGELGTELLSEHSLHWDSMKVGWWPWPGVAVGVGMAVVVAVTAFLLVVHPGDMQLVHFVVLLLVVGAVVAMASSDSDALVLIGIAVVAVVAASTPREERVPEEVLAVPDESYFLVLGDSYISGEGADAFVPGTNSRSPNEDQTHECRRARTAWPVRLAESPPEGVPSRMLFLACSGAVTENIAVEPRIRGDRQDGPAELDLFLRERERLGDPAFVLLSVGGNDAGFSFIGKTCVAPGSCARVSQQFVDDDEPGRSPDDPDAPEDLASIGDDLLEAYDNVREVLPDVPVVVVPYPTPVTGEGACTVLLDRPERVFLRRYVAELDRVIEEAAASRGFFYMDTMESSVTPLCSKGLSSGLHFVALNPKVGDEQDALWLPNWFHNNFHPTEDGHREMATAARRWFEQNDLTDPPAADRDDRLSTPTLARAYQGTEPPEQCSTARDEDCEVNGYRWTMAEAHQAYQRALLPLAVLTISWWLLLTPLRRAGRRRGVSLLDVVLYLPRRLGLIPTRP